ncbi:hypothetical protein IGB42_03061 [Andreprevotia sp. IGB-42]|uniref:DUF2306 domain-containing protein n=1 Tax=Andreprevotia sp. IGB-42 TaxID=2497473 RepID=UPI00135BE681|nr:DUF2306 domain-containing protein [Andreprevotia sp. IGB-42]KAF0812393.1 hypothetical protein IGB42_03061 [Andreprevotia sp. IGB-42]
MSALAIIHLAAALLALLLGGVQLALPRGGGRHKLLGCVWLAAMAMTALTSFALHGSTARFSWVHLLSLWVLFCVVAVVRHARRGEIDRHRAFALGAYLGLLGAGIAALLTPGRLLHDLLLAGAGNA